MKGRPTKLHLHAVEHFRRGAIAAAHLADGYNAGSSHAYRLGDCILAKLNIRKTRPRKSPRKILSAAIQHKIDLEWYAGMALALAEVHRRWGDGAGVAVVAREAGLTIAVAKQAGVDPFDWKELRKAGVK